MGIIERNGQQDDGDTQQRHNNSRTEMKETELMSKPVDGGMMKERISMGPGRHGTDLEQGSIERYVPVVGLWCATCQRRILAFHWPDQSLHGAVGLKPSGM